MTRWRPSPAVHYLFAATVALAALSLMLPRLDIALMQPLFVGHTEFLLDGHPFNETYKAIRETIAVVAVLALLGLSGAAAAGRPVAGIGGRKLLAAWGTLLLAVGLIVNLLLKNGFGRPRPEDSDVFGGTLPYIPAWTPGGACSDNCSFVSGDVAFAFMGVAFALWLPPGRARWLALGATALLGLFTGAMRMLTGNHYPTDVLFAALLTSLTALVLHDALVDQQVPLRPVPGWLRNGVDHAGRQATILKRRLRGIADRLARR